MSLQSIQDSCIHLRSNKAFELFVVAVIVFSALIIGVKTYPIPDVVLQAVVYLDWMITIIFLFELIVRFLAEEDKKRFFHNGWNIFDTLIVIISLVPIEDSEMAFIGRLVRIFRVLRMISIVPELRLLLNSLLKALPQLGYVVLLMFIIFYIYAAIGSTIFASINPDLWGDIAISMLTLFRVMTFEDWTDVMYETMKVYPLSWSYYISFIFLTAFAFLNMVIGIVVNVLEHENARVKEEEDLASGKPTIEDISAQLAELKTILEQKIVKEEPR